MKKTTLGSMEVLFRKFSILVFTFLNILNLIILLNLYLHIQYGQFYGLVFDNINFKR